MARPHPIASLAAACLALSCTSASSENGGAPQLSLPIDCVPGRTCFIQQYFDHDPGPDAKDHRCGSRVYDGHDGVDIRLPTLAAQERGVAVLAAAAGLVRGRRDGEPDRLVETAGDRARIAGRECGNGVVLEHAGGWQTQYCHMARGSIAVSPGQQVRAGDRLGLVGLSGDTQFPHLHLSVRAGQRKVDPFAPDLAPNACRVRGGPTLWSNAAGAALAYRATEIVNIGFAARPVTMADVERGAIPPPDREAPALVFYARSIGLRAGDRVTLRVADPAGAVLFENATPIDRDKAQWLSFGGRKRPAAGWRTGSYRASYEVLREGRVAVRSNADIELR